MSRSKSKYKYSRKRLIKSSIEQDPVLYYIKDLETKRKHWYRSNPKLLGLKDDLTSSILQNNAEYYLKILEDKFDQKLLVCKIPDTGIEEDILELLLLKYYKNYDIVKIMKYKLINTGILSRNLEYLEKVYCLTLRDKSIIDQIEDYFKNNNEFSDIKINYYSRAGNTICINIEEPSYVIYTTMNTNAVCNE